MGWPAVFSSISWTLSGSPRCAKKASASSSARSGARRRSCPASSRIRPSIFEILRHERPRDDEVVEEPVVGRWSNPALRAWKELRHRGGEQMRRRVPVEGERVGAVRELASRSRRDRADRREIDELAVNGRRQRLLHDGRRQRCGGKVPHCRAARRRLRPSGSVTEIHSIPMSSTPRVSFSHGKLRCKRKPRGRW